MSFCRPMISSGRCMACRQTRQTDESDPVDYQRQRLKDTRDSHPSNGGFAGPSGEFYASLPTEDQLQAAYGLPSAKSRKIPR